MLLIICFLLPSVSGRLLLFCSGGEVLNSFVCARCPSNGSLLLLCFLGYAHMTRMLMGVGSGRVAMALEGG